MDRVNLWRCTDNRCSTTLARWPEPAEQGQRPLGRRWTMKKPPRIARWQLRNRLSVVELTLPRQVTPTRAPGDPAQSITVLLLAPVGPKSADLAAGILHLGVGRVLRVSSIRALRRLNHTPTTSDVAIIGAASWSNSRRLHRRLRRAGWSAVLTRSDVAAVADGLALAADRSPCSPQRGDAPGDRGRTACAHAAQTLLPARVGVVNRPQGREAPASPSAPQHDEMPWQRSQT